MNDTTNDQAERQEPEISAAEDALACAEHAASVAQAVIDGKTAKGAQTMALAGAVSHLAQAMIRLASEITVSQA